MSDLPPANKPVVLAEIVLVPLEDEDDDFETLSAVEDLTAAVLSDTAAWQNYRTQVASDNRRSTGVILLLGEIAHQVITQKDLIIAFLQAGTAAIGALASGTAILIAPALLAVLARVVDLRTAYLVTLPLIAVLSALSRRSGRSSFV